MFRTVISFLIQNRAHEWLFSSEEGQWAVVESSKAARLVMVTPQHVIVVYVDSHFSFCLVDFIGLYCSYILQTGFP